MDFSPRSRHSPRVPTSATRRQAGVARGARHQWSRIGQGPLEKRLPAISLCAEDYCASGATSIADFVQRTPISDSAINCTSNTSRNLGYPPDGGGKGHGRGS